MFTVLASALVACSSVTSVAPTASVAESFQLTANIDSFPVSDTSEQLELALANDVHFGSVDIDFPSVYAGYGGPVMCGYRLQVLEINNVITYQFIKTGIRFVPLTGETVRLGYWQAERILPWPHPLE
ncbi:hypothetical protein [Shewanella sp.]|uniref:hypothetical protein n=1 Tax=Shewanella sp. TaxID=50422 RepID=UPI003A97CAF8